MNEITQPNVAIDTVPVVFREEIGLRAIVAPRQYEPYKGEQALPGVLLLNGESVAEAGERALDTKASVIDAEFIQTLGVYDDPGRDPRSTTLTIARLFAVASEAIFADDAELVSITDPPELPFDHQRIIAESAGALATLLETSPEFVKSVLGNEFETNAMREALESVGASFNSANLARTLSSKSWITKVGQVKKSGAGRPATLWSVTP